MDAGGHTTSEETEGKFIFGVMKGWRRLMTLLHPHDLFIYFFFETGSHVPPGWPQTHYIAKDNFELILLSCLHLPHAVTTSTCRRHTWLIWCCGWTPELPVCFSSSYFPRPTGDVFLKQAIKGRTCRCLGCCYQSFLARERSVSTSILPTSALRRF